MPVINVKMIEGRTLEQKRELVKVLTAESARILNTTPDAVTVIIDEYSKENYAKQGILFADNK